ncbi:hypothetical protein Scep_003216 [Stephania cephalantha]|uniref:Uncharacterized protein n=1 Tax=Stephania cephalantha TaxID=152367 RepID=A0AAP0KQ27_9MAGN
MVELFEISLVVIFLGGFSFLFLIFFCKQLVMVYVSLVRVYVYVILSLVGSLSFLSRLFFWYITVVLPFIMLKSPAMVVCAETLLATILLMENDLQSCIDDCMGSHQSYK